ncbi:MAG: L,D-transpeptidase [Bradyrhizobium sp.]
MTAAGAIGVTSQSEAAIHYWQDSYPGFSWPAPTVPQRRQRVRHHLDKKEIAERELVKPQGPLIISISIAQQKLRVYDANGVFAETPVSTGMPGHPTPMGVFSVIQKQKFHHSNIYSGAPMPFMQRITWSGVAIHAGVLPGRPASHGCIRMPMAFAVKMWNWTRLGARVVITPGEVTPVGFSHPQLATLKVPPQPIAADEPKPDAPPTAGIAKADTETVAKPVIVETSVELRSTIGHDDGAKSAAEAQTSAPSQKRTADARNIFPASNPSVTMSDAAIPAVGGAPSTAEQAASHTVGDSSKTDAKLEAAKAEAGANSKALRVDAEANEMIEPEVTKVEAKADEPSKIDSDKSSEKPAGSIKAVAAPAATIPEPNKDQIRPSDVEKAAALKANRAVASKRADQIAVFISRKDSKLYVRQNFAPLFEVPVAIAPDERPLGTHVFTARVDKEDANLLHWSVVSLPAPTRHADRLGGDARNLRKRKIAGAGPVEVKPLPVPDSPAEALDRLTLPPDALARITEAISTGGSIIVSDQGIAAGETGEGTDFIVSLR